MKSSFKTNKIFIETLSQTTNLSSEKTTNSSHRAKTFRDSDLLVEKSGFGRSITDPTVLSDLTGRETILIFEEESMVRRMTLKLLTRLGYKVCIAANPEQAVQHARRLPKVDLLLTNVTLAESIEGDVAAQCRELHPEARTLFTPGYSLGEGEIDYISGPNRDFIPKPYTALALAKQIRSMLDK